MPNDVEGVLDELYGLAPEEFVPARDAAAKSIKATGGSREEVAAVKGARRPTVAAWLVNLLSRERPDEVASFVTLGEGLRVAQQSLEGNELRALSRQRQQLISALVRETRGLARDRGRTLSDAVVREVEATLDAALADPESAQALVAGRLVSALEHVGFGGMIGEASAGAGATTAAGGTAQGTAQNAETAVPPGPSAADVARLAHLRTQVDDRRHEEEQARTAEREAQTAFGDCVVETRSRLDEVTRLEQELVSARELAGQAQQREADLRAAVEAATAAVREAAGRREEAETAWRAAERRGDEGATGGG